MTHSRSDYAHWIELYDAGNQLIDVKAANAPPYSPRTTCGRCHDYETIAKGHHFNAIDPQALTGRAGEPWIWTDPRTGTELPLSYRNWPSTYQPNSLGLTPREFVLKFGRQLPGGGPGEPVLPAAAPAAAAAAADPAAAPSEAATAAATDPNARWKVSGMLSVDCMICHSGDDQYSQEVWWQQIENENFAWASAAALGMADVKGKVSGLPDNFDPAAADSQAKLPQTTYKDLPTSAEGKVFVDVIRTPRNSACYYCHSSRYVGPHAVPEWNADEDVHLRAGLSCTDCHRNGIEHATVRGFEGETHPSGQDVSSLSCRGCHLGDDTGHQGRLGAPKPQHKGLPPLHLDRLSCTACHSGPQLGAEAVRVQTAMAHGLGLPSHDYADDLAPGIVAPVMMRDGGVLYPHRVMWPAFWGSIKDDVITPLNPNAAYDALRTTLRVRRGSTLAETFGEAKLSNEDKVKILGEARAKTQDAELTADEQAKLTAAVAAKSLESWQEKLAEAFTTLQKTIAAGAQPVYVSGGKAYRLGEDGKAIAFDHAAAKPYAWKLAHDVRPARMSLGIKGCYECHASRHAHL